jgi:hypothetical protein
VGPSIACTHAPRFSAGVAGGKQQQPPQRFRRWGGGWRRWRWCRW